MCNFQMCVFELFKMTSIFYDTIKNIIKNDSPNKLSIYIHKNFIELTSKYKYYIQKDNDILDNTSLIAITDETQLQELTTNYFIPYIILFYNNKQYNLELQN